MQCYSNTIHCAIFFYPQTHTTTQCFHPTTLSVIPQPQQQQQQKISNDVVTNDAKSKLITSASNPFVKHCLKLRNNSSYRRSQGSVLVVGSTPIRFLAVVIISILN
jgi:TrmH family RNA methyltransferase